MMPPRRRRTRWRVDSCDNLSACGQCISYPSVLLFLHRVCLLCVTYLLDVVIAECAAVLQLLAGEDQTLLVRWDALLVLDLALDIVDGITRLDLKGDGLARQGLDEAAE